jgi:hypothetical protein
MKTVRELLLRRHAEAGPRLETLRVRFLAGLAPQPAAESGASDTETGWRMVWHELVGCARAAWILLGVGATVAVALQAAVPYPPSPPPRSPGSAAIAAEVLAEQTRLMAELLGTLRDEAPRPAPAAPEPPSPSASRGLLPTPGFSTSRLA